MMKTALHGDVKKLTNFTPEYRLRAGNYRILFEIDNNKIIIYRIIHTGIPQDAKVDSCID